MNIILFIIMVVAICIGYIQFVKSKEDVNEVEHEEAESTDSVNCIPYNHYCLHGLGKWRRDLNHSQKVLYREMKK